MPTNERLRGSPASAQLRLTDIAERIAMDPWTVDRWITEGCMPYRTHRIAVAQALKVDEVYLWPQVLGSRMMWSASVTELLEPYPSPVVASPDAWNQLIASTHEALDVLTYAGKFLFEPYDICSVLRAKSAQGVLRRVQSGRRNGPDDARSPGPSTRTQPWSRAAAARAPAAAMSWPVAARCRMIPGSRESSSRAPSSGFRSAGTRWAR